MTTDLIKLDRIRSIPDIAVKEISATEYEIISQADQHQETIYSVTYLVNMERWFCSCKDYLFRNNEDNPDYECKHIGKVRELLIRRLSQ